MMVESLPAKAFALALALPALALAAPGDNLTWRLAGPFRGGWSEMVEGVPSLPDRFYFGASGGGIWRSDDAGHTWRSVFDQGPAPVGAIAIAPGAPDTVWAGTGQPEPRYDLASGAGVFRTDDGGKTWRTLGLEKTLYIGRISLDPRTPETALVAAVGDFFKAGPDRGVYLTRDGGKTWTQTLKVNDDTGAVDLTRDPNEPQTVFAATWQARQYPWQSYFTEVAGPGSGIYASTDGGAHWVSAMGEGWPKDSLGRISLAATRSKTGALRLYAVVSSPRSGGLWRSDDGGGHWVRANPEMAVSSYYASRVTVDPTDPDVVWLVGQSIRRCDQAGAHCVITKGAPGGDDYHFVWVNPAHPDHMALTSDQGTTITVNGGASWSSWYNQPTGQFYHLAADKRVPYLIYSGQQDSGTVGLASRGNDGGITERDWRPVGGEERDYDVPDNQDPDIVYGSGLGGTITRWDRATGQVANVSPYLEPNYGHRQTETKHRFVWITPLIESRVGPDTLYLGAEVVFASTDRGRHWSIISPDLTGKTPGASDCGGDVAIDKAKACGYGAIWSIEASPLKAGEIWVGTDDGLVQVTRDGGARWIDVSPPAVKPWEKIASVDPAATDADTAYIAVDAQRLGDRAPRAYATHDGGKTWKSIGEGLPAGHPVNVVRADPVKAGLIYAGTDAGAFVSTDDGAHWAPLGAGLPNASVRDLTIHGADLIAATQGRAIWILDDVTPLRQGEAMAAGKPWLLKPEPALRTRPNTYPDTPVPPDIPQGTNPPTGAVIDYGLATPAKTVTLEIRDASGDLVRTLTSSPAAPLPAEPYFAGAWLKPPAPLPTNAGAHRIVWDLHAERPKAMSFDYSISANTREGALATPAGAIVPAGAYSLNLIVDGKRLTAPLTVVQDPRSTASAEDMAASYALSRKLAAAMATAWRGEAELEAVKKQQAAFKLRDEVLTDRLKGFTWREPAEGLARLEAGLENSDQPPSAAQIERAELLMRHIAALDADWTKVKREELPQHGGPAARFVIPPEAQLSVESEDDGEDLP
jgi:photosystem II stability/assembly factor-like uncharacterized protein